MKIGWLRSAIVAGVLILAALPGAGETSRVEAASAASELASRLGASPPVSAWVGDASKETSYQADVNRMTYLSSMLAAELSKGMGPVETASLYRDLRSTGIRILTRSRTSGEKLPAGDVQAFERLMSTLEAFYAETLAKSPR